MSMTMKDKCVFKSRADHFFLPENSTLILKAFFGHTLWMVAYRFFVSWGFKMLDGNETVPGLPHEKSASSPGFCNSQFQKF